MALFSLLALALSTPAFAQKDNGEECSCFRTSGHSEGFFTFHRFHDFRNVVQNSTDIPTLLSDAFDTSNAPATSTFFSGSAWDADWAIQTWNNSDTLAADGASVLRVNSQNNVYIETSTDNDPDYTTYLTLRTAREADFQSTAEIQANEANYHYVSARFMARVIGDAGACAGLFTYLSSTPVQEADIEILTSGPKDVVQYTNQPSVDKKGNAVAQATSNATVGADWTEWNVLRMDWMPKMTAWYVNGEAVATIKYQVPKSPAGLIMNMWSDGGVWTGNMSLGDEALLQIQWIELVYNASGDYAGSQKRDELGGRGLLEKRRGHSGCEVVCSVDEEVNVTGTPAFISNNTATALMGAGSGGSAWISAMVIALAVFGFF